MNSNKGRRESGKRVHPVEGHRLMMTEGKILLRFPDVEKPVPGALYPVKCTCGLTSSFGLTDYRARTWHRDHRLELLNDGE